MILKALFRNVMKLQLHRLLRQQLRPQQVQPLCVQLLVLHHLHAQEKLN